MPVVPAPVEALAAAVQAVVGHVALVVEAVLDAVALVVEMGGAAFVTSSSVSPTANLLRCVSTARPSGAVPSTTAQTSAPAK